MTRNKKKPLKRAELHAQAALDLPNREALSLLEPGLGIVDLGATTQPTDGTATPTDGGSTPTDGGATSPTSGGLEGKASKFIGPLPALPTTSA
jgi:hypothetical protein